MENLIIVKIRKHEIRALEHSRSYKISNISYLICIFVPAELGTDHKTIIQGDDGIIYLVE